MKNSIKHIIAGSLLVVSGIGAMHAQNLRTGYFLQDYTYRYQMNPAMANSRGFFAMPALGNMNLAVNGTLGLSDVLYNVNGRTVTFMHPEVPTSEVLGNIGDHNKFGITFNTPILAMGFKALGGYNTITLSAVADAQIKIPGSIFTLLKEGIANKTYDIGNIDAYGRAYAQLALGHSHDITDELRIGANLKLLFGAGNVTVDMEHADLELGTDAWNIVTEGELKANAKGLRFETDVNETTGNRYVSNIDFDDDHIGLGGFGVGVDLGAVYSPKALPDFSFSASVLDLGFINWSNCMLASTQGRRTFTTDKYTFNVDGDAPNSFKKEFDKIKDDLSSLYELADLGNQGSEMTSLAATINVGAEYTLPMYKAAKFGILNTTRLNGQYTWTDFRLSANWAPCSVFDASVSAGAGTFGASFGCLLNLHCSGFNLFVGMDQLAAKYAKQGVPLSSKGSVNLGLNFLF